MEIAVAIDLSPELADRLSAESGDLPTAIRDSFAINLFRRGILTHHELGGVLGLDRLETDALLQRNGVTEFSLTHEDVDDDIKTLERAEVVPFELTDKWLAWSPDRLKILGHGDTIAEARAMGGGGKDLVITRVPRAGLLLVRDPEGLPPLQPRPLADPGGSGWLTVRTGRLRDSVASSVRDCVVRSGAIGWDAM